MPPAFPADFVAGALTTGYLVIGLLFIKFWRRTRDSFFLLFAIAFALLASNQAAFTMSRSEGQEQIWIFTLRLAAFALIIAAIVLKNIRGKGSS